jgi:hypothetical protein
MSNKYRLPTVAGQCAKLTGLAPPDRAYPILWQAIVGGRLPAEKHQGVWSIAEEHLPLAATLLGMAPTAAEAAA